MSSGERCAPEREANDGIFHLESLLPRERRRAEKRRENGAEGAGGERKHEEASKQERHMKKNPSEKIKSTALIYPTRNEQSFSMAM